MRLAFMGSPDFAVPALRALLAAGHTIAAVYCQKPKPAGRGYMLRPCPVQVEADRLALPVRTPARLRSDATEQAAFAALGLDAAVVVAYGLILPQAMLDAPRRGCLNIHASLLPRWRGAAPIQTAVLAGDAETGVTIMRMDAGLDTGPMLLREAVPITATTTAATLHDVLAEMGARLVLRALAENPAGVPQPEAGATYAPKLTRDAGRIDWTRDAGAIERQVRAFDPWPGTFTTLCGVGMKVLAAAPAVGSGPPGTVLDERLTVACGSGALRLIRVQLAGRPAMAADVFLRGHAVPAGTVLGSEMPGREDRQEKEKDKEAPPPLAGGGVLLFCVPLRDHLPRRPGARTAPFAAPWR
jgi:methionyl-tRNA formyltransferase